MRRVWTIIIFLMMMSMPSFAGNYVAIDKLENSLFGMTYTGQDDKSRIERLEKNIYGAIQQGNLDKRIEKISKDMTADMLGQEITPTKFTEFEEEEDNSVDYPLINDFEKKIFNQEFKNKKLEQRISNLEKKVFNKTYPNDDLSTRKDRLKSAIHIDNIAKEEQNIYKDYETFSYDDLNNYDLDSYRSTNNNLYKFNKYNPSLSSDEFEYNNMPAKTSFQRESFNNSFDKNYDGNVAKVLNALEKKILKKTYPNDSEEVRLERLEESMFSATFSQDTVEARLERLAVAYKATKSAGKYDTNKLSQHMATAMQVGVFILMILAMVL